MTGRCNNGCGCCCCCYCCLGESGSTCGGTFQPRWHVVPCQSHWGDVGWLWCWRESGNCVLSWLWLLRQSTKEGLVFPKDWLPQAEIPGNRMLPCKGETIVSKTVCYLYTSLVLWINKHIHHQNTFVKYISKEHHTAQQTVTYYAIITMRISRTDGLICLYHFGNGRNHTTFIFLKTSFCYRLVM